MPVRKRKPTSPGRRFQSVSDFADITTDKPEKSLTTSSTAVVTTPERPSSPRWRSQDQIPFDRLGRKRSVAGRSHIEYDPNRVPLPDPLPDGEKRYIIAPQV